MPVYGNRPEDVVVDAAGNVQTGATLTLHATQADAQAKANTLATVVTSQGRWSADVAQVPVWVRTPNGAVYQITDFAAKADKTYVDSQIGGLSSTYAQQWKASTEYAAGQAVVNPSGDIVTAKAAHTSGTTFNPANWNLAPSVAAPTDGTRGVWDGLALGAKGNGTTNDTTVLQNALNAIETAGGGTLVLAPGRTFKVSQLLLGNNTTLHMTGAKILRTGSSGGSGGATLRNKDQVNGNTNVAVIGGRITSGSSTDTGKHVAFLKVNQLFINGLWIERPYSDWAFFARDCDRVTIPAMTIAGGATALYEDGFHIEGCRDMAVGTLNVECGDDAVALVQTTSTTRDMHNITFGTIVASSAAANLFKIEIDPTATAGVNGVTVGNLVGDKTGATAGNCVWIMDQSGGKKISRVSIANAEINATNSAGAAVIIQSATDLDMSGVHIDSPDGIGFDITSVDRLTMRGCSTRGTRGASIAGFRLRSVTEFDLNGCRVVGATQHGFIIGANTYTTTDGSLRGCVARSCTGNGIQLDYATNVDVTGNRIKGCAWGIREEAGGAANNYITGNDVRGNTSAVSAAAGDYNGTYRDNNLGATQRFHTFVAGDTTPSVIGGNRYHQTANTAATSITTLDDGLDGQEVVIIVKDAFTTFVNSVSMHLEGGTNWTATANDTITFVKVGGQWIETGRSTTV